VVANYLDATWERIGRPDRFVVVDMGAGPGTLARTIFAARPRCTDAMDYVAVELSAGQRARHPGEVTSTDNPPTPVDAGVIIANELLDNVPFRLLVFDDGWRESFVTADRSGRFVEVLSDRLDDPPGWCPPRPAHGARVPLVARAAAALASWRANLGRGAVLVADYGVARTAELATRPWQQWLRTYRDNQRGGHYLSAAGAQDITTDVPFDQLAEPDWVRTQSQFLQLHGIDELVAEGRRAWSEQAARPGLEAMRMRSRVAESEALLDPAGLGSFLVAEWPEFLSESGC
jgi:SAM-dependent MidA family methyltransferase